MIRLSCLIGIVFARISICEGFSNSSCVTDRHSTDRSSFTSIDSKRFRARRSSDGVPALQSAAREQKGHIRGHSLLLTQKRGGRSPGFPSPHPHSVLPPLSLAFSVCVESGFRGEFARGGRVLPPVCSLSNSPSTASVFLHTRLTVCVWKRATSRNPSAHHHTTTSNNGCVCSCDHVAACHEPV